MSDFNKPARVFWSFAATYTVATADTTVLIDITPASASAMKILYGRGASNDDVAGALSIGVVNADNLNIATVDTIGPVVTPELAFPQNASLATTAGSVVSTATGEFIIAAPCLLRLFFVTDHIHVGHMATVALNAELFGTRTAPTSSKAASGTPANVTEVITENTITIVPGEY